MTATTATTSGANGINGGMAPAAPAPIPMPLAEGICGASKYTFKGGHVNHRKEGHGVYEFANGMRYEGQFKRGKRHGHGVYFYPSGARFVGEWVAGKRVSGKYEGTAAAKPS